MQKPSKDPRPQTLKQEGTLNHSSPSSHRIVCSLKLKSLEKRALTPVKKPQLQGAKCLQPALAALLAPLLAGRFLFPWVSTSNGQVPTRAGSAGIGAKPTR